MLTVAVSACRAYDIAAVRRALADVLAPLGGMGAFVRPGMRVLLKPNLLSAAPLDRAITTHPSVVQAAAEAVQAAGGTALMGDSPAGPASNTPTVWQATGMVEVARRTGAALVPFDDAAWRRVRDSDYVIARPVLDADLVINLPKLKTHEFALYTGAVKNLFGAVPGARKREAHLKTPGIRDFSETLVDILEIIRPGLTILDGIVGQEGAGPGARGTPRAYGCLAASVDPVALDTVLARAMGYGAGTVLHLGAAAARGLGTADAGSIPVVGSRSALNFGRVRLPSTHWYFRMPSQPSAPLHRLARLRPQLMPELCAQCGACAEVCPRGAIQLGGPPQFDLDLCVGCMCCAEACPQGAIRSRRNRLAALFLKD